MSRRKNAIYNPRRSFIHQSLVQSNNSFMGTRHIFYFLSFVNEITKNGLADSLNVEYLHNAKLSFVELVIER